MNMKPRRLELDGKDACLIREATSTEDAIDLVHQNTGTRWTPGCVVQVGFALDPYEYLHLDESEN